MHNTEETTQIFMYEIGNHFMNILLCAIALLIGLILVYLFVKCNDEKYKYMEHKIKMYDAESQNMSRDSGAKDSQFPIEEVRKLKELVKEEILTEKEFSDIKKYMIRKIKK